MTLFRPSEPSWYLSDEDRHILQAMDKTYQQANTINQSFWSEADIDSRFRAGDQTLWEDVYGNLPAFRKRQFQFNRIRRICNMITGYQRRNRKSTVVVPRENADNKTAEQFTKLMYWAMDYANTYSIISEAFDQGALTTGMSLLSLWADYRSDPISGDIRVDVLSYNSFLIDPYFRKHDLSDCNFIWTRKYLSKIEAKSLYPQKHDLIDHIYVRSYRDGKFQFLPESYQYGMQDLMYYDEYWYRDYREQTVIVDPQTGETMEWVGNEESLQRYLKRYPKVTTVKQTIPTVKLATVLEGHVLYHGRNPLGFDKFPFVPILGYYDPQIPYFPWRIQGVVRGLRDAQYLYNRRKVIELDILESQVNSGWKVKEDALVNPKDAFLQGQGRLLTLKQEADMRDVEQIPPPAVPASMIQLSQLLGEEIQQISGVNEELLGMADDDKAGVLAMLRQGAGLTTLQILFDQLDAAQKYLGQLFIEYMQKNFTPGKIKRIIQEQPTEEFYHRCFGKYDAAVEEGVNTSTQRQTQFLQLLHLRETGIPVSPAILLENATLSNKTELVEYIQKEEQQQAQQQNQELQTQMELLKAQIQDLQSRAAANQGLGMERVSRIEENRALAVERLAESRKDQDLGALHLVKALKELEGLDLQHLRELLEIAEMIKTRSVENTAEEI